MTGIGEAVEYLFVQTLVPQAAVEAFDQPILLRMRRIRKQSGGLFSRQLAGVDVMPGDAVILRPHAVYGPGDTTLLPRLLAGIRRGRLTLPEGAAVTHTLTHIDNLVAAVILALDLSAPAGIFNVGDDAPVLLSDVLAELLAKKGRSDVTLRRIPYGTAFALASGVELAHRVSRRGRPRVTRYAVSQLGLERTLDLSAARKQLGYRPRPTSLAGAERW